MRDCVRQKIIVNKSAQIKVFGSALIERVNRKRVQVCEVCPCRLEFVAYLTSDQLLCRRETSFDGLEGNMHFDVILLFTCVIVLFIR